MLPNSHVRPFWVAILLCVVSTYTSAEPASVSAVTPEFVQVKRAEQVQVSLTNATPETHIAVQPGGPYISGRRAIPGTATALSVDTRGISWVGTAIGEIDGYRTSDDTNFTLVGQIQVGTGIAALASNSTQLYAATTDGDLVVLDIQTPGTTHEIARLPLGGIATAMAVDVVGEATSICVVLDSNTVVELANHGAKTPPTIGARHPYPDRIVSVAAQHADRIVSVAAEHADRILSVAAHNGECHLGTARNGIVRLQGDTTEAVYRSAGPVHSLQHNSEHWLSVDGVSGLSLFGQTNHGPFEWMGSYNRVENAQLMASDNDSVLVADESGVLSLIDTRNTDLPALVTEFRLPHSASAIGLHERHGFALAGNELIAIDFTADAALLISPLGVNLGGSRRSFVDGELLYVADWFSGLHIYDIADPKNLHHLTTFHTVGSPKGVFVSDHIAYVADDDQGLQVVDVSNPLQPKLLAQLPLSGLAYTMKRVGDLLYLAAHRGGLHIINIADPLQSTLLGTYDTPGKAWAVDILDHYAYIADDSSGVLVLDIANPAKPELVGEFNPGGTAEDLVIRNGLAYVTFFDQGLFVLDLSRRTEPRALSHLDIAGNARGIVLRGDVAFISAWQAGVITVDIRQPSAPKQIGQLDTAGAVWGLSVAGNDAFVMDWWGGLRVVDISDPSAMQPVTQYQAGLAVSRLAFQRGYLYAAGGDQGLHVFDAKNTLNPVWANAVELSGSVNDVAPSGDYAFVAAGRGGLAVVDITTPIQARLITQLPLAHRADRIVTAGKKTIVAEQNGPLTLIDSSQPKRPQRLAVHTLQTRDITASQDAFIVATHDRGLLSVSTANGTATELDPRQDIRLVRDAQQNVYTVDDQRVLTLYERQGQRLIILATLALPATIVDMTIRDHLIYLASSDNGLWVVEHSQNSLRLIAHYPSAHLATSLAINNNGVFLGGPSGVSSGELLPPIEIQRSTPQTATVTVPANMPMGAYDIAIHTPGQPSSLRRNAFKIGIGKAKKTNFTLEDLKRVLKQPQFEGKAPK